MTNPPLNADDELRAEIDDYIDDIRYNNEVPFDERLDSAKKSIHHLVKADRKKHELQARLDTATDILYGFSRTCKQEVTDSAGNVYVNDSHSYISKYEVRELVEKLKQELEKL